MRSFAVSIRASNITQTVHKHLTYLTYILIPLWLTSNVEYTLVYNCVFNLLNVLSLMRSFAVSIRASNITQTVHKHLTYLTYILIPLWLISNVEYTLVYNCFLH